MRGAKVAMNERDARLLRAERVKFRRIKAGSRRLQRLASEPTLDLAEHPFCADKQLTDWIETHGSRTVRQELRTKRDLQLSGAHNLQRLLADTLDQIKDDKVLKRGFISPRTREEALARNNNRPRAMSPGGTTPLHVDVLSLVQQREAEAAARAPRRVRRVGALNSDDLYRLVHAPEPSADCGRAKARAAATERSKQAKARRAKQRRRREAGWEERVFDPALEPRAHCRRGFTVNAVGGNDIRRGDMDIRTYRRKMSRIACGIKESPFCLERQWDDALEMAHANFHCTFPDAYVSDDEGTEPVTNA